MKIVTVNIREHGDGKRVYITVTTGDGMTFTVNGDNISVNVEGKLLTESQRVTVEPFK